MYARQAIVCCVNTIARPQNKIAYKYRQSLYIQIVYIWLNMFNKYEMPRYPSQ